MKNLIGRPGLRLRYIYGLSVFLISLVKTSACMPTGSPDETIQVKVHRGDNQTFIDMSARKGKLKMRCAAPLFGGDGWYPCYTDKDEQGVIMAIVGALSEEQGIRRSQLIQLQKALGVPLELHGDWDQSRKYLIDPILQAAKEGHDFHLNIDGRSVLFSVTAKKGKDISPRDYTAPTLTILSPASIEISRGIRRVSPEWKQNPDGYLSIEGQVDDESGVSSLTIAGIQVRVDDNGAFSLRLDPATTATEFTLIAMDSIGNIAKLTFQFEHGNGRVQALPLAPAATDQRRYHALVIGNNDYIHISRLEMAVNDAREVSELLESGFGFAVQTLYNAGRITILDEINRYKNELSSESNLLIYYAGHGHYDQEIDRAFWLPVDADDESPANWISADDITAQLRGMASRHVLIVSDSCYSGALSGVRRMDWIPNARERSSYLEKMIAMTSRTLIASGGNQPVLDGGGSGHSVFAKHFMQALRGMESDIFTAREIFDGSLLPAVAGTSDQVPIYSAIRNSGHEWGDFVFFRHGSPGVQALGIDF